VVSLAAVGCGAPGDPLPPLLNIPARTTDFAARQQGAELVLAWTLPGQTTEASEVKILSRVVVVTAEVETDKADAQVFSSGARDLIVLEDPKPGERVERRLPLPAAAGHRLAVAVRNEGSRGRTAGYSNIVVVTIVPPLAAPGSLRATLSPAGIRLEWDPVASATGYRIFRRRGEQPIALVTTVESTSFLDAEVEWETPVTYLVRAYATTATGAAESPDSVAVSLTPTDSFPPSTPEGLNAVVGEGVVELSWSPSPEPDTAGYHVYRSAASGAPVRLTSTPLATPAFSDRNVQTGAHYAYNVSAVDEKGNESPRSTPTEVTIP
jgi:hypothetical protein